MSLSDLSIRRPTFITAVVTLMLAVGWLSMRKLGVDLFPNVTFPFVAVTTIYPGAGPEEIETLVSKPIEDELSTLNGIKRLTSKNQEGISTVFAEFTMETDVKYAEQQIRDRMGAAKKKLPEDTQEPIIRRLDPADQPIIILSIAADLPDAKLFDVADDLIRPRIEQVNQVGLVEIFGGRKREVQVALDRSKLKQREISVSAVAARLAAAGENVPVGRVEQGQGETVYRSIGEFRTLKDIEGTIVSFYGSDVPTTIRELGEVKDSLVDESSRAFVNGRKSLFLYVYRQSGANTIAVVDAVKTRIAALNQELQSQPGKPGISIVRDGSIWIRANVDDVKESILIGVVLAVLVVFLFLGNGRSTIITGLALPNSLIGAFILMAMAGFTINIMTLLALSLSVGLLIDDAIVVRENIFRHIEMGKPPVKAAKEGTDEVRLAVIATSFTVIAVFGPVGFLKGVVGQFFREFGLTICFAMTISLFDALTVAPMLSAYFAGASQHRSKRSLWGRTGGRALDAFDRFQTWLEIKYEKTIHFTLKRPLLVLGSAFAIFVVSLASTSKVAKTFLPTQDSGEFSIAMDLPPGTNLQTTHEMAKKVEDMLRARQDVELTALTVGGRDGEGNLANFYVRLIPAKQRKENTSAIKERIRQDLVPFAHANPKVKDYDPMGVGMRPFNVLVLGNDQKALEEIGQKVFAKLKAYPGLKDVDLDYRPGKPELQVVPDPSRVKLLGISSKIMGGELRAQVEGITPAKLREGGREYDIRVRLREDQRDLRAGFGQTYVPNVNGNLIRLTDIAKPVDARGPAAINRQNRSRYVSLSGDIAPGAGIGDIVADVNKMFDGELKLPEGMSYMFLGQAENFQELADSMVMAVILGTLFIFLVLASLYESFVTPFTIMLALPLAMAGSFVALLVMNESLNIFSMIGTIMLLGVATKNSILLVDYANQLMAEGLSRADAIARAGRTRLRPILMTTMALIAGSFPIAMGLNEASRQRTSMGVAIIGGLISSTLLTLVVVPAAFSYIDRFRVWSKTTLQRVFGGKAADEGKPSHPATPAAYDESLSAAERSEAAGPAPLLD